MKKRITLLAMLGIAFFGLIGFNIVNHATPIISHAENETQEYECYVTIAQFENGEVFIDKEQGNVGEIVNVTVKHDLFYLVNFVSVNGNALIENEQTSGLYSFALVQGENLLSVSFVIDQELLGDLSVIYEQAKNKDWTHLFSVDNVLRIVSWILEGGILIAIIRYFVKDKKLTEKLEKATRETVSNIIPESTRQSVAETISTVINPMVSNLGRDIGKTNHCVSVLVECIALMQENTPEAKLAILQNLKKLNIGENVTLNNVEEYIKSFVERTEKAYKETMQAIEEMAKENKEHTEAIDQEDDRVF